VEKYDESKLTRAIFTIYSNDPDAWGIGFELRKMRETHYIASLYVQRDLFPSKRRLLREFIIPRILREIPTKDELIIIKGPTRLLRRETELRNRFGFYVPNQHLKFTEEMKVFPSVKHLSIDSIRRKNSITERLIS
jgi:hypothetical protein